MKNAVANLARGGASGIAALFLPAVLVRHMTQLDYTVWVLVLQIAAYSGYLDFGLQTAIGRYVAFANEKQDAELRNGIFSTAFFGLSLACVIFIVLLFAAGAGASWLFPQISAQVVPTMRWALLIVGSSVAIGLPASAWSGVFVGLQRNEIPAIVTGGAKIVSAVAVVAVVLQGHSIIVMAAVLAVLNLFSYLTLFGLAKRVAPEVKFQNSLVRWSSAKELSNYCYSLTIWSFAMMLVTGLDLLLVGRFQVSALGPYAVAASLVTFVAGAQSAIFSAMIPRAAVAHAQQDPAALGRMVLTSTRVGVLLLVFTGMPLLLFADPIMVAWVGRQYAIQAHAVLLVLVSANMIRLTGVPYSVVLIGAGQQKLITLSPLVEGLTNLVASVLLGLKFGAMGVAWGTLIGAGVGVLGNLVYNIPRTNKAIRLRVLQYLFSGIVFPALAAVPFLVLIHLPNLMHPLETPLLFIIVFVALIGVILYRSRVVRRNTLLEADSRRLERLERLHANNEHP
ncbi:MAG: oligosaccharide flippase family protein [Acidobacteriia bacterium]|nr:oligosaccharide flippase family protein [Terriglobia bacterium]